MKTDFPILEFKTIAELRQWLERNHTMSPGILVRLYRRGTGIGSVRFEDVLDEGLCFG